MTKTQTAAMVAALSAVLPGILANSTRKTKGRRGRKGQGRVKLSDEQKAKNAETNAREAEELFKSKGFADCRANITIKTWKGWAEAGRKVKAGERSLKHPTRGYPLFHLAQTEEAKTTNAPEQNAERSQSVQ